MKIKVLTKIEDFYELKVGWNQMEQWCCLFTLYDWLYLWWKSYGDDDIKLRLYIAENESGDIVAIFPLMLIWQDGKLILTQLGNSGSDYFGIVCDPNNRIGIVELLDEIKKKEKYDRFVISNLRVDYLATDILIKSGSNVFNNIEIINQGKVYYVDTSRSYEDYFKSQSRNYRHKINQISKYAAKYEFAVIDEYSEDIINEAIRLHKARWMKSAQLSVFFDQRRCKFFHLICKRMSEVKKLRLFILKNNRSIKAYRIGFVDKGIYYDWNTALEPECMSDSVGILLCDMVVKYCCDVKIKEFDFLRGEEEYKKRFATGFRSYLAIDLRRDLEIEGYVYEPPIRIVREKLKNINCVVFVLRKLFNYDVHIKYNLKELITVLKRIGINIFFYDFCTPSNENITDVLTDLCNDEETLICNYVNEHIVNETSFTERCPLSKYQLIIGDSLEDIIMISGYKSMTCLYVDDFENRYLINKKPDLSIDSFTDLIEYLEDNSR